MEASATGDHSLASKQLEFSNGVESEAEVQTSTVSVSKWPALLPNRLL